jgi:subtilisin family serine protease
MESAFAQPPKTCRRVAAAALLGMMLGGVAPPALAQLGLPSVPSVPSLPSLPRPRLPPPLQVVPQLQRAPVQVVDLIDARRQRIAEMLRQRSDLLEPDQAGQPLVRGELVLDSPSATLLAAARADGFSVVRERVLDALDMRLVTLRAPAGWDTRRALQRLRELDPQAAADYNHLYLESGETTPLPPRSAAKAARTGGASAGAVKVGLIDAGVETDHPLLAAASIRAWGCGGTKIPTAHGTAVASLLVGRGEHFRAAAPSATLYAADVYCADPIGGSIEAVAAALAWLIGERVPIVNISLVGPANRTLQQVVRRAHARGVLLVAAVGNDGPAAAPLYPAAYPEVVAVTAVDARGQVLPEAGRGPHVAFAAPGSEMAVAGVGASPYAAARGTSFASPLVAGLLAQAVQSPQTSPATLALQALAREAFDLGTPGRDAVYGHGLVARELRTDPALVHASTR